MRGEAGRTLEFLEQLVAVSGSRLYALKCYITSIILAATRAQLRRGGSAIDEDEALFLWGSLSCQFRFENCGPKLEPGLRIQKVNVGQIETL